MRNFNPKFLLFSVLIILISGCANFSSLSGLKFWGDDEEEIELPAELQEFNNKTKVTILWKKKIGPEIGFGSNIPVITNDFIYFASSEGEIVSLSSTTGKEVWVKKTRDYISASTGFGYKKIFIGTLDGEIVAFNSKDGLQLWRTQLTSEILSPPVTDGSIVIAQTSDGKVTALDFKSGAIDWVYSSKVPNLSLRGTSTPLIAGGQVIATFANGKAVMISSDSGSVRWELPLSINEGKSELERIVDIDGQAVIDGKFYVAASYQGNITSIDLTNGRPVWQEKFSTTKDLTNVRSRIVGINAKDIIEGFGLSTGITLWQQAGLKLRGLTSPVSLQSNIIVGDSEGYIHILDSKNGDLIGRKKISGKAIDHIVTFSNSILATDKSGLLISLSVN
tara:strand:- start:10467 stop:11642 length:1176 start_codon:yes stop_codon:yes gene_type:complete